MEEVFFIISASCGAGIFVLMLHLLSHRFCMERMIFSAAALLCSVAALAQAPAPSSVQLAGCKLLRCYLNLFAL